MVIYKITSPSNKIYIGQTTNFKKRISQYKSLEHCRVQTKLYRSFIKYGIDNHIFEIIEECKLEELNNRERYWQDFYNSVNNGLNCKATKSTDKSGYLDESTKNKMKNVKRTDEHKKQISVFMKDRFKNNSNKEKQSKWLSKPVIQCDLEGNFIKEWESISIINKVLGFDKTAISNNCNGRYKYSNGFIWKFKI